MKANLDNVEDIYPLSPMQQSMLLASLSDKGADVLFNQFCYRITGKLQVDALKAAWQQLVDRHSAFRTTFLWENLKQPLQIVKRVQTLPFVVTDWQDQESGNPEQALETFCQRDRAQGFDLAKGPLIRIALIRVSASQYFMVWSSHHLIVDRWCLGTVYRELIAFYEQHSGSPAQRPESAGSYRDYINWLGSRDLESSKTYWRDALRGFNSSGTLTRIADTALDRYCIKLGSTNFSAIRQFARLNGLTMATVVQAAWALVINRHSGRQDVAFGASVSGRPHELAGVESTVGTYINNVLVRVTIPSTEDPLVWLKKLQRAWQQRDNHVHVSLTDIYAWTGHSGDQALFDSVVVWLSSSELIASADITIDALPGDLKTAYPMTLGVDELHDDMQFQLIRSAGVESVAELPELLDDLIIVLRALTNESIESLSFIPGFRVDPTHVNEELKSPLFELNDVVEDDDQDQKLAKNLSGREDLTAADLRLMLRNEWGTVLRNESFTETENFFDLGGTSLQATRLHAVVEINIRKNIPLLTLFQQPTVQGMLDTILREDWPMRPNTVIPVRPQGKEAPLFCIASPDVNTLGYAQLARYLSPDRPLYILQAPPDSGHIRRLAPNELSDYASNYVKKMKQIQPRGPYNLLGMCTGAQIATEMGRLLESRNEATAFLSIVNTWGFYTVSRLYYLVRFQQRLRWYITRFRELSNAGWSAQLVFLQRKLGRLSTSTPSTVTASAGTSSDLDAQAAIDFKQQEIEPGDVDASWVDLVGWTWLENKNNTQHQKLRNPVTVFRIDKQAYWRVNDDKLGWSKEAKTVFVERLPGNDHDEILREPRIKEFCDRLDNCLLDDV